MRVFKSLFLSALSLQLLFSATTVKNSGITLGEPRVYHSFKDEDKLEFTLMRVGKRSDKTVLIHFKTPGHELHKKSFIYEEKCETTRCDKVLFRQKGGKRVSLISHKGYYAEGMYALLPGEAHKIWLYYDDKLSKRVSRSALFDNYLHDIYRDRSKQEIKELLALSLDKVHKTCANNALMQTNMHQFEDEGFAKLLGMGKPFLDQLATTCKDPDYREIFKSIKKVTFEFSPHYKEMILTKMHELIIYLSPDLYNPDVTAKHGIDNL